MVLIVLCTRQLVLVLFSFRLLITIEFVPQRLRLCFPIILYSSVCLSAPPPYPRHPTKKTHKLCFDSLISQFCITTPEKTAINCTVKGMSNSRVVYGGGVNGVVMADALAEDFANSGSMKRHKLIIDTDPGIDDSMAILMAFQSPDLDVLGLTTIYGNVTTEDATRNALLLCEIAGYPGVPVAQGSPEPLKGGEPRVADFVHGSDGLGNIFLRPPKSKKIEKSASEFLVDKVCEYPGEVSILALGPLTNLALAVKRDSSFASKVKRIVILGGAFFALGNVNPAAEANIYGDPEAADVVFTSGANIDVVGINITTQVKMTDADLDELRQSRGKHAQFVCDMCKFYRDWHVKSDGVYGIFLHDPVSFVALVRPDLFTYKKGVVRVETQGMCVGHTLMDQGLKKWNSSNPWTGHSPISVAWTVDVDEVLNYIMKNLMKP